MNGLGVSGIYFICPRFLGGGKSRFVPTAAVKQDHIPGLAGHVLAKDVDAAVVTAHLEITMTRVQPAVNDLPNRDRTLADQKAPWALISPLAGIAFHLDMVFLLLFFAHRILVGSDVKSGVR